jgi:hypothetical protein
MNSLWDYSLLALPLLLCCTLPAHAAKPTYYSVGAASIDITPDYPIRLSGYGARVKESDGIDQRISAQALAIGTDAMICFDRPTRLQEGTEELIVSAVHNLLPAEFLASTGNAETATASR